MCPWDDKSFPTYSARNAKSLSERYQADGRDKAPANSVSEEHSTEKKQTREHANEEWRSSLSGLTHIGDFDDQGRWLWLYGARYLDQEAGAGIGIAKPQLPSSDTVGIPDFP